MCLVRSARRCSMWMVSVQMRLATNCSSKSARCMKAEKLSPSPTGSMIVKRTLPGGRAVKQPQHGALQEIDGPCPPRTVGLQQQERTARKRQHHRQGIFGLLGPQPLVLGQAAGNFGQLHLAAAQEHRRRDGRRRRPAAPIVGVPMGKRLAAGRSASVAHKRNRSMPDHQRLAISFHWWSNCRWLSSRACSCRWRIRSRLGGILLLDPAEQGRALVLDLPEHPVAALGQFGQPAGIDGRRPPAIPSAGGARFGPWRRRTSRRPSGIGPCGGR